MSRQTTPGLVPKAAVRAAIFACAINGLVLPRLLLVVVAARQKR